ncbi:hypothetical protein [Variovorax sp. J31P207]|uniref:hypothetical protein n=1 Tax=Variovorax sp. J31P207 TaxID=3053510 RepID=UPI002578844D|nr:hypothetical protein [Variovorax sp. J31P207]MDM0067678.1 hypothetical protein [Variovorax sp. J31P207]
MTSTTALGTQTQVLLPHNRGDRVRGVAIAISAALTILALVPFMPQFSVANLDSSWSYAMNVAVGEGLQFGRDLIFTYGPLASIATHQYFPATDSMMIIGSLIIAAAVFLVFWGVCDKQRVLWLLALPVLLSQSYQLDPVFTCFPLLFLLFCVKNRASAVAERFIIMVGAIALGLMPLIKGNYTPAVLACTAAALPLIW